MSVSDAAHRRQIIDELIDRAHSEWPSVTFIMAFPTGEQVLLPRHQAGLPPCDHAHDGYYNSVIRPHCAADPLPRVRGTCRMVPLRDSPRSSPEYLLELRSGAVTTLPSKRKNRPTREASGGS